MAPGTPSVTVLVPTHSHGRLLRHPVAALLGQTVPLTELLIVGDGADDETREVALELARADGRVEFLDNPKGPGHGLAHRHAALLERARGDVVLYMSDDDLCLPEHVETMVELLDGADFAHALGIQVKPDDTLHARRQVDLDDPWFADQMRAGRNLVKFSTIGHTLEAYRRLPGGWANALADEPYEGYYETWREFLRSPGIRLRSGTAPTVLRFPTSRRDGMSLADRDEELARWRDALATPAGRVAVYAEVLDVQVREARDLRSRLEQLRESRGPVRRALDAASARVYSLVGRD